MVLLCVTCLLRVLMSLKGGSRMIRRKREKGRDAVRVRGEGKRGVGDWLEPRLML